MGELGSDAGSSYPGTLDTRQTFSNKSVTIADGPTRFDAELMNDMLKAILTIETELGTDPAGSLTDVKTRLDTVISAGGLLVATGAGPHRIAAGMLLIGDTANTNMTQGLTINQGASDNAIFELKSSDVAHGITLPGWETDTFFSIQKQDAGGGGVRITGIGDAGTSQPLGIQLQPVAGLAADATKSTAGVGVMNIKTLVKNGTDVAAPAANGNLLSIGSGSSARFIFDADGDSHQDVGTAWTNFDDHDDANLLNALSFYVSRPGDPIKERFKDTLMKYGKDVLELANLVTFNDDGHHFVNYSQLTRLLTGAVRQQSDNVRALQDVVAQQQVVISCFERRLEYHA